MATFFTMPAEATAERAILHPGDQRFSLVFVSVLTVLALAIHGYHPYAEDGGLYMAGVKHLLNPALYPRWSEFVTEHLRFSLFAPLVAGLVRGSHLSLMTVWLVLYVLSLWMTIFACWLLAVRCYSGREARYGAVALLTVWITMPIAGTSLMLMDPYFSARSISTPCALFALAGVLDLFHPQSGSHFSRVRGLVLCLGSLTLAALVHPLMAAYALGCVLLLSCLVARSSQIRIGGTASLGILAFLVATALYVTAQHEPAAYRTVALTRSYWFIGRWAWYEQFGLVAPLGIFVFLGWSPKALLGVAARRLCRMAAIASGLALLIALLFTQVDASSYLLARLQPLRIFQLTYIVMILTLGSLLGDAVLKSHIRRWSVALILLASVMLYMARQTFPSSNHVELPWGHQRNNWERAFQWISSNTPTEALFALDAHYISASGEDAQTFRSIAERSVLPDFSKDGGEASITPSLTAAWTIGQTAQTELNTVSDAERLTRLLPHGVTWIVLPESSRTAFACRYDDGHVKVCQLPAR